MKIFRFLGISAFLLFSAVLFTHCGGEGAKKPASQNGLTIVAGPEMPINTKKTAEFESLEIARRECEALIQHRKGTHPNPMAMLTQTFWTWAGFFNGQEMVHPDRLIGQWIKFEDNFTYSYGYYDDVNGTGIYHYRLDDDALLMLDDNEDIQPKEWALRSNGTAIVLEGRHGFKINNGMQMKMGPNDRRPTKG